MMKRSSGALWVAVMSAAVLLVPVLGYRLQIDSEPSDRRNVPHIPPVSVWQSHDGNPCVTIRRTTYYLELPSWLK